MPHATHDFSTPLEAGERGFPIRVALNFEERGAVESRPRTPRNTPLKYMRETSNEHSTVQPSPSSRPTAYDLNSSESILQVYQNRRYEYTLGDEKNPSINGTRKLLRNCEDEQIHIPGSIQSSGFLVALQLVPEDELIVRVVSENCESFCQHTPSVLFAQTTFLNIVLESCRQEFKTRACELLCTPSRNEEDGEPMVFTTAIQTPFDAVLHFHCAMHTSGDLLVCEFELRQQVSSLAVSTDDATTEDSTTNVELNLEQQHRGTDDKSSRARRNQASASRTSQVSYRPTDDGLTAVTRFSTQLLAAKTLEELTTQLVRIVRSITSMDRVMVYQFDSSFNGSVIAEEIDPKTIRASFLGHRFPASDIPAQARDLYVINKVRLIFDREAPIARLVCRSRQDLERPLDLTHSFLRAISPIHLKYLANMGVRSSLSISLESKGKFWGLINCHSYSPLGNTVSFVTRRICRWISQCASSCLETIYYRQRLQSRESIEGLQAGSDPLAHVRSSSVDLLKFFNAASGFLCVKGEARSVGRHTQYREAVRLLRHVSARKFDTVVKSHCISKDFPELESGQAYNSLAGFLYIPLCADSKDFLLLLRDHLIREITWAGRPYDKPEGRSNSLEPRSSFAQWTEVVTGTSEEWTEEQHTDSSTMIRLVYTNILAMWREKEVLGVRSRMKLALLRNATHEVRTPLHAVINYLELALEVPLDKDMQVMLQKCHSASHSLIGVVDDLLHLTSASEISIAVSETAFDIRLAIAQVIEPFRFFCEHKSITFTSVGIESLPNFVKGDVHRFQQAVVQVVSNAISNTKEGAVRVEVRARDAIGPYFLLEFRVLDTGVGLSEDDLDDLFQDLEQVSTDDNADDPIETLPNPAQQKSRSRLGLGLAIVARFVLLHQGQFKMKSVKGKSTVVTLNIPWQISSQPLHPVHSPISVPKIPTSVALCVPKRQYQSALLEHREAPELWKPWPRYERQRTRSLDMQLPALLEGRVGSLVPSKEEHMTVAIADDNPVNLNLLRRRLEKYRHSVISSPDGQHCFISFQRDSRKIQFVLMDLDMPLVDGKTATRLIREFEKQCPDDLSETAKNYGRTPIFAVSASLWPEDEAAFIEIGFDGWILKPVNFKRLKILLDGASSEFIREVGIYSSKRFKAGGWFESKCRKRADEE